MPLSWDEQLRRFQEVFAHIDATFDRLDTYALENRYFNHVGWFGKWLRKPRRITVDDLPRIEAALTGGELSEDDVEAIRVLDLLVIGNGKSPVMTGEALLAIEVSQTIDTLDVERASARAALLRRAGYQATGLVGGNLLTAHASEAAKRDGVIIDLRPS